MTHKIADLSVEDHVSSAKPVKRIGISAHLALINFLKGMVGPGCFSLPLAFKSAGLWAGFVLVLLLGCFTSICMKKLVRSAHFLMKGKVCDPLDYGKLAEKSFQKGFKALRPFSLHARVVVNICLILLQLGVCSVFYIFVTDNVKKIVDHCVGSNTFEKYTYMLIILLPFLFLSWIQSVYVMSYISLAGNILMIISIIIIFAQLLVAQHPWQTLPSITSFQQIAIAAGAVIYSFEGQAMVLPLENRMEHPSEMLGYTGVIQTGISLVSILYTACGFYGYITFGDNARGTITLNLPDNGINLTVNILLSLIIFTGFLIQLYPVIDALTPLLKPYLEHKSGRIRFISSILLRSLLVIIAVGAAFIFPNLEDMIPLVGVSAGMSLALIFPSIIHLNTFLPYFMEKRKTVNCVSTISQNMFFIILGLCFSLIGLQVNIEKMMTKH